MESPSEKLIIFYKQSLQSLMQDERQAAKIYKKLASVSKTDELKTAMATDASETKQHIERLLHCKFKDKSGLAPDLSDIVVLTPISEVLKQLSSIKSEKDLAILHYARKINALKITLYEELLIAAKLLDHQKSVVFLEQTLIEKKNSCAYLHQIAANIIYPHIGDPECQII